MKALKNLILVLTILTLFTIASNGIAAGLIFFLTGAAIISIGRYANSFLTSNNQISKL